MYNSSILDSNRLINIKNQQGLNIVTGNSVGIYSAQSKLRKAIIASCVSIAMNPTDLKMLADKVVDRCDDIETVDSVTSYLNSVSPNEFIEQANGKIRPFFKLVKNFIPTTEFTGESKYIA